MPEDVKKDELTHEAIDNMRLKPSRLPERKPEDYEEPLYFPLDHKYELVDLKKLATSKPALVKAGTQEAVQDWIIFRAQDAAVYPMLRQYFKICSRLGSPKEHLDGISELLNRVKAYQEDYSCKVPD